MKISVLASGSKGNCTMVSDGSVAFLVDMGISMRRLKQELAHHSMHIEDLAGIFITHEHGDHVKGLKTLTKNHQIPLITRQRTAIEIAHNLTEPNFHFIDEQSIIKIGNIQVANFSISHDVVDPCGFFIKGPDANVTIATDLGKTNKKLGDYLAQSQGAVLEANYDDYSLRRGSYPLMLKKRIAGIYGHLSNDDTGKLLASLPQIPQQIILAHLSQENNMPTVALNTVQSYLKDANINLNNHEFQVGKEAEATTMEVLK